MTFFLLDQFLIPHWCLFVWLPFGIADALSMLYYHICEMNLKTTVFVDGLSFVFSGQTSYSTYSWVKLLFPLSVSLSPGVSYHPGCKYFSFYQVEFILGKPKKVFRQFGMNLKILPFLWLINKIQVQNKKTGKLCILVVKMLDFLVFLNS